MAEWDDRTVSEETWQSSFGSSAPSIVAAHDGGSLDFLQPGDAWIDGSAFLPQARRIFECSLILFTAIVIAQSDNRARIASITPSRGLIISTVRVRIRGSGFGSSPTVQAGPGILVEIVSKSDTTIDADFTIAANAPAGNHDVTVTRAGSLASPPVKFFVQVPTSLKLLAAGAPSSRFPNPLPTGCPSTDFTDAEAGDVGPFGMNIFVRYQVMDQDSPTPEPIKQIMILKENLRNFFVDGTQRGADKLNADVTPSGTTDFDGTFLDNGVGACATTAFGQFGTATFTQELFIPLSSTFRPTVRAHNFSQTGLRGCGTSSNGGDIRVEVSCEPPPDPPPPDPGPEPGPIIQATSSSKPPR